MDIIFVAFIVVMLSLLRLLLAVLIVRITTHRQLMTRWSVVSVLWVEMLQRLPDPAYIRIPKNLRGRRL